MDNAAFEFFYDDIAHETLTVVYDGQWADFRREHDGVYFAINWGANIVIQGNDNVFRRLGTVLDGIRQHWPSVVVDEEAMTLFIDEPSKTYIKLKYGFVVA